MHIGRKIAVAGTVLALAVGTTQSATADPRSTREATPRAHAGVTHTVTLLSGDRVIVTGDKAEQAKVTVRPATGRERTAFRSYVAAGHLYVIPSDAGKALASGTLDRRLFDVTLLIESKYDDASRASLPVIVTHDGAAPASLAAGTTNARELPAIHGTALDAAKGNAGLWNSVVATGAARAAAPGIRKVWLDGKRTASLDRSVPQIGAPAAWAAGITGTGVKIAILDTGVDQTHPDLATQEVAEKNFSDAADNVDRAGHGTHVASTAAGTGAKAGGKFKGVAFGAQLLDGKVLNDQGFGFDSWIIAGMQWAADQGAKVANLSLGGGDTPEIDPIEEAVNTLSAQFGILYVIAAGNSGQPESVSSPGSADAALTVGAVDRNDAIAPFSSRGPRIGDGAIKPDITAPGVGIVAAKAAEGFIGTPAEDGYVSLSGTSMATPHVAGSAALLAQQHPTWTGAQIKAALTASAKPNPALTVFDQGSGRVDVAKAITQTITSEPTNVSLGTALWPHDDDRPVTKPLTYHNFGSTDVTLNLATSAKGPDGQPAPNGVFSLSATTITVPAGGQAQVTLTGNPKAGTLDGVYSGSIVATAGSSSVITPFAITREVESYNLTINARDAAGAPTADYSVAIIGYDDNKLRFPFDQDGSVTVRLAKGRYFVDTTLFTLTPAGEIDHLSMVEHANTDLKGDRTLDASFNAAKPISVSTPDSSAKLMLADIGFDIRTSNGRFISLLTVDDLSRVTITGLGPAPAATELLTRFNTQWSAPSGAFYGLAWFVPGQVPTGFTKQVKQKDLATLEVDLGTQAPGRAGVRFSNPQPKGGDTLTVAPFRDAALPSKQIDFYNTDGTTWSTGLLQLGPGEFNVEAQVSSTALDLKTGRTDRVRLNHAQFGPAFPKDPVPWALRFGDIVDFFLPLFSDSAGHAGFSNVDKASTKLFRNGTLVAESANPGFLFAEVPPEVSDYKLTVETSRASVFDVTTQITAAWTFRSGHVDGEEFAALPLSAVRFSPKLDNDNAAKAGRPFLVPVALQLQSGDTVRPPRLSVDVSYDEGKTWKKAEVLGNLAVLLFHPADSTSVSLRAKATDRDGNTVEQTVIRAYKLKK